MNINLIVDNLIWNTCNLKYCNVFYICNDADKLEKVLGGLEKKLKQWQSGFRRRGQCITVWPDKNVVWCLTYEHLKMLPITHPPQPNLVVLDGTPETDDWNTLLPTITRSTSIIVINSKTGINVGTEDK